MAQLSRRVFDDENDRWIEVREGETDGDALLRARRDGAPSVLPPQGRGRSLGRFVPVNRPLRSLGVIALAALIAGSACWLIASLSLYSLNYSPTLVLTASVASTIGGFLAVVGACAGIFALTAAALIEGLSARPD